MSRFRLNIAGDFYLESSWIKPDLFDEIVCAHFEASDMNMVNLECPVVNGDLPSPINKTGPNIFNTDDIAPTLKELNIHAVTLANNHIMDYGEQGLRETFEFCANNAIRTVGAGIDLKDSRKPLVIDRDGTKISIINFAENEWASATENESGANPMDLIDNGYDIRKASQNSDHVIVIVHGGHEYYPLPSPQIQKRYRYYVDCGASMVISHHTHCISGYEEYQNSPIFYGIGNFLFTTDSKRPEWYRGLILNLGIDKQAIDWEIIPVEQDAGNFSLRFLDGKEKDEVMQSIEELNKVIANPNELEIQWKLFVEKATKYYLKVLSPNYSLNQKYGKSVLYFGAFLKKIYGSPLFDRHKQFTRLLNHLRCESHRSATIQMLKNYLKDHKQ